MASQCDLEIRMSCYVLLNFNSGPLKKYLQASKQKVIMFKVISSSSNKVVIDTPAFKLSKKQSLINKDIPNYCQKMAFKGFSPKDKMDNGGCGTTQYNSQCNT